MGLGLVDDGHHVARRRVDHDDNRRVQGRLGDVNRACREQSDEGDQSDEVSRGGEARSLQGRSVLAALRVRVRVRVHVLCSVMLTGVRRALDERRQDGLGRRLEVQRVLGGERGDGGQRGHGHLALVGLDHLEQAREQPHEGRLHLVHLVGALEVLEDLRSR